VCIATGKSRAKVKFPGNPYHREINVRLGGKCERRKENLVNRIERNKYEQSRNANVIETSISFVKSSFLFAEQGM